MRYFFDTEFIEEGNSIHLISIGIVADDGREFYAEVDDSQIPWDKADPWVLENVKPLLRGYDYLTHRREDIGPLIRGFTAIDYEPEFWAWYGSYDWVALAQTFGTMVQLPDNYPMFPMDIRQWLVMLGNNIELPKQEGTKHDALEDARWNRMAFYYLREVAKTAKPYIP